MKNRVFTFLLPKRRLIYQKSAWWRRPVGEVQSEWQQTHFDPYLWRDTPRHTHPRERQPHQQVPELTISTIVLMSSSPMFASSLRNT